VHVAAGRHVESGDLPDQRVVDSQGVLAWQDLAGATLPEEQLGDSPAVYGAEDRPRPLVSIEVRWIVTSVGGSRGQPVSSRVRNCVSTVAAASVGGMTR
jgi:hypothetical protein